MYGTLSESIAGLIDGLCETYALSKLNETKLRNVITGRGNGEISDQRAFILVRTVRDNLQASDSTFQDIWVKVSRGAIKLSRLNQAIFDFLIMVPFEVPNAETNFQQIMEAFLTSKRTDEDCKSTAKKINQHLHFIRKELQDDYGKLRYFGALANRVIDDYRSHSVDECIFKNWLNARDDEPVKFDTFAACVLKILKNVETPSMVSFEQEVAKGHSPELVKSGRRVSTSVSNDVEQVDPFGEISEAVTGDDILLALEELMESLFKPLTGKQAQSIRFLIMSCADTAHSIPLTIVRIHCLQPLQNRLIQSRRMRSSEQEIDDIIKTTALDGYEVAKETLSYIKLKLKFIVLAHRYHKFLNEPDADVSQIKANEQDQCKEAYKSLEKRLTSKFSNEEIGTVLSGMMANTAIVYSFIMKVERVLEFLPQEGLEKHFMQDRLKFVEKCTQDA